jgi:hypothetical protein
MTLVIVIFAIAAIWLGTLWVISLTAGWWRLARAYRSAAPFNGKKWHLQLMALRANCGYGLVTFGADSTGVYVAVPLGRLQGHPSLFIPWEDVSFARLDPPALRVYPYELRPKQADGVPIRMFTKLYERLIAAREGRI